MEHFKMPKLGQMECFHTNKQGHSMHSGWDT